MLSIVKTQSGRGHLELRERPRPQPGLGQVVLEVIAAGVCGTDLHIEDGEFPCSPPVALGHEIGGVVVSAGAGVPESLLGARVATETYFATCGHCAACRAGRINLCPDRQSIGSHVDGGFAHQILLPARNLHPVPERLSDAAVSLCEPLACVCQCLCDPAAVSPGDKVLVIGPGPMGLLSAQVARAQGGSVTLLGTDRDSVRLAAGRQLGFNVAEGGSQAGPTALDGAFDVVVECSGSAGGAGSALRAIRKGGRYVQVGLSGKPLLIDMDEFCYREVDFRTGFASTPRSWRRALALIDEGLVNLETLVTGIFPLTGWTEVFHATRSGEGVKFVFDPRLNEGSTS
ncbi:alcohol dehydrogenase catalytic domain-containing protein [Nonomuraea sp. NPDC026600]|uniref:alcohol dehydrogenase catalytic domain-containing protein n=1 Tax=Nonomuraea sp. NPDC026600 TaxID=3155363 RepID=UPI003407D760